MFDKIKQKIKYFADMPESKQLDYIESSILLSFLGLMVVYTMHAWAMS